MKRTGKLVRIVGGREWELWSPQGYAGLQAMLRMYEGREVVVEIREGGSGGVEEQGSGGAGDTSDVEGRKVRRADFAVLLGVDKVVAEAAILAGYRDLEDVRKATDRELLAVAGLGRATLRSIREVTG